MRVALAADHAGYAFKLRLVEAVRALGHAPIDLGTHKLPGIRAGLCHDSYSIRQAVEHDDLNLLALGTRVLDAALAQELVGISLAARFTGETPHRRRLAEITTLERRTASLQRSVVAARLSDRGPGVSDAPQE